MVRVSIVMPVYNAMPYLEMSIKSIFAQTFKDWELIIVDDNSTDGSWEFLQRIKNPKVKLFRNDKNYGHSYTKNRCINLSEGKFIARMDADDISLPQRLEKQIEFLENHSEIDVVGCGSYKVTSNLELIHTNIAVKNHHEIINLVPFDLRFIFGPNFQITDGTLVARSEWFKKYKYDEKVKWSEDYDLMIRALKDSIFANIEEPLYIYIRTGTTASIKSQIKSVKQRFISTLKYNKNLPNKLLLLKCIISLFLRPLFIILTLFYHKAINNKVILKKLPSQVIDKINLIKSINIS